MDELSRRYYGDLRSADANVRYEAFSYLLKETQLPVDWAYEVWDELLGLCTSGSNHERSIAAQLLVNLAKSDPDKRILRDFDHLLQFTSDDSNQSGRQVLQSLWKVGVISRQHQDHVVAAMSRLYAAEGTDDKRMQTRLAILEILKKLYAQFNDEEVKDQALALIAQETDEKKHRKLANIWVGK